MLFAAPFFKIRGRLFRRAFPSKTVIPIALYPDLGLPFKPVNRRRFPGILCAAAHGNRSLPSAAAAPAPYHNCPMPFLLLKGNFERKTKGGVSFIYQIKQKRPILEFRAHLRRAFLK
jgi:hypothetical protein